MSEIIVPGSVIKQELEHRGWEQRDLAFILGRHPSEVSGLVTGTKPINPELAQELATALGNTAEYWLALEASYRLRKIDHDKAGVMQRLKLYENYPIKDMIKRGWIEPSADMDLLEDRVCKFLGIDSVDDAPKFSFAARKSAATPEATSAQLAWMIRVRQLAPYVPAVKFTDRRCNEALEQLRPLMGHAEEIRHVPRILSESGIRFVLVEALPATRIDGVCTWLDRTSPVIGVSLRLDRVDGFWHTLLHEMHHVKHHEGQDNPILDLNLVGEDAKYINDKSEMEKRADLFASEFAIKKGDLDNFIARVRPLYSKAKIKAFADLKHVNAGMVVGQLQFRGEIPYSQFRDLLVKVRHLISDSALTDGWGYKPSLRDSNQRVA
jgi:HTH-type transcriptional regulator / antitoxin HigA